jgi:hypothetical protein
MVPQYLVDQAALVARAGRPFANTCMGLQLPDQGMSLIIPRGTTGAATAIQATENSSVQNTDEVWANLTVPVATIAGQQDVSRQSLERGTPGIDQLIYAGPRRRLRACPRPAGHLRHRLVRPDARRAEHGRASTRRPRSARPPRSQTFYSKLAGQLNAVETTRFSRRRDRMHPRRWNWLVARSTPRTGRWSCRTRRARSTPSARRRPRRSTCRVPSAPCRACR